MKWIKAMQFAINAHDSVNHKYNGSSYTAHLAMVAHYALKYKELTAADEDYLLAGAWLHDTIEDCRLTYNDIKQEFGEPIAELVYALTNDKGKNRKERATPQHYEAMRKVIWATYIKLCDRLANVNYSVYSKSSMVDAYRKENEEFIKNILPRTGNGNYIIYEPMINELNKLLQ